MDKLLPYVVSAVNSRSVPIEGSSDRSTSPLELLAVMRASNEAEADNVSLLGERSLSEDPHRKLALLGALHDEWGKKGECFKATATGSVEQKDIKVGDSVLIWRGKERSNKGKKLDNCYVGPATLIWRGKKGGCAIIFPETGNKRVIQIGRVKTYW